MKLKCVDNENMEKHLTLGKIYEGNKSIYRYEGNEQPCYDVVSDAGLGVQFHSYRFKVVL